MKKSNTYKLFVFVILLVVGLLIYGNSFTGEFVFDDAATIVENPVVTNFKNIGQVYSAAPLRFLSHLSFVLNYKINGLTLITYHFFNLLIHVFSSFLVFLLVEAFSGNFFFSLTASLLFVSHPIQTQAVTYITQRMSSLSALFYLLSLYFYAKAFQGKRFLIYFFAALAACLAALFTKENTFTLPFAVLLLEFTFFSVSFAKLIKRIRFVLPFFLLAGAVYLFYLSFPIGKDFTLNLPSAIQGVSISRPVYLLTQFKVIATYIGLLFLPINQNVDYDYPLSKGLLEIPTLLSFFLIVSLLVLAIAIFKKNRFISFGILFFFITLLVESSIIPIADVIFEHRLYLPSVGFVIATAAAFFSLLRGRRIGRIFIFLAIILLISLYSFATYNRNKVWQNEYALWSDTVKKSPNKARPHFSLGMAYAKRNQPQEAVVEFQKTLTIDPKHKEAYNNLGITYVELGKMETAVETYLKGLYYYPLDTILHTNLATAYLRIDSREQALMEYRKVLLLDLNNTKAHHGLGTIYWQMGDFDQAAAEFQKAINSDRIYLPAWYNLKMIYEARGEVEKARDVSQKIMEIEALN